VGDSKVLKTLDRIFIREVTPLSRIFEKLIVLSASQEFTRLLQNQKLHWIVHKGQPSPRPSVPFCNVLVFFLMGVFSTPPNPQAGGSPLVGCPRLFV
jgi:hypothetical protein